QKRGARHQRDEEEYETDIGSYDRELAVCRRQRLSAGKFREEADFVTVHSRARCGVLRPHHGGTRIGYLRYGRLPRLRPPQPPVKDYDANPFYQIKIILMLYCPTRRVAVRRLVPAPRRSNRPGDAVHP